MARSGSDTTANIEVHGRAVSGAEMVLTPAAFAFVADLTRAARTRLDALLAARRARQAAFDRGERPDFLGETAPIRRSEWMIAPVPRDEVVDEELQRIRAEIGDVRYLGGRFPEAREPFMQLTLADDFEDFLTVRAYDVLDAGAVEPIRA